MIHIHWITGEEKMDRFQAMKTSWRREKSGLKSVHKDFQAANSNNMDHRILSSSSTSLAPKENVGSFRVMKTHGVERRMGLGNVHNDFQVPNDHQLLFPSSTALMPTVVWVITGSRV